MDPVWTWGGGRFQLQGAVLGGKWSDRRWMNTPGPIYTGNSDFALLGPTVAPELVALDDDKVDVIYQQPMTSDELDQVLRAADGDPFDGYAADGNDHWTVVEVRQWWNRVPEMRDHIRKHLFDSSWWLHPSESPLIRRLGEDWMRFLDTVASTYLREYCHFLDAGSWPRSGEVLLDL